MPQFLDVTAPIQIASFQPFVIFPKNDSTFLLDFLHGL